MTCQPSALAVVRKPSTCEPSPMRSSSAWPRWMVNCAMPVRSSVKLWVSWKMPARKIFVTARMVPDFPARGLAESRAPGYSRALDGDAIGARPHLSADMAFGGPLAQEDAVDPHPADLDHLILDHRLGHLTTQKPPADAHGAPVEIADIQHFLAEAVQQQIGAGIGTEIAQLQRHGRLIDIVHDAKGDVVVEVIAEGAQHQPVLLAYQRQHHAVIHQQRREGTRPLADDAVGAEGHQQVVGPWRRIAARRRRRIVGRDQGTRRLGRLEMQPDQSAAALNTPPAWLERIVLLAIPPA